MTARVLVVDDNLANIKLLEARLMAEYFEVLTATGGQQALEICDRERVDVVLLDVMMPGMDGLQTLAAIRELPGGASLPVVLMTARVQLHEQAQPPQGVHSVIAKPFDPVSLASRLQAIWERIPPA